ncbi:glycosyltransferase family 2 protein [Catalinimonas niigatensis]|uniref:glycosyltransferase family 2 protein n=1 Tax=Catalinimonas niigatensis TaxID=1397264 RepID=UPI0026652C29|nr:glycosyltransferase family 2 protein [Catalinimonas niigatensis]WPP50274.1 glycosyltransferase family 2 protein [Catalinimonas niigatensis]
MIKDLTIGLVNYNTKQLIIEAIDSVKENTKGVSYDIVVVDNASKDGSQEVLSKLPGIKYIQNKKNVGFPSAVNQAMKVADSRYFVAFNSDAKLINDAFTIMIDFMDKTPKSGISTAQLYFPDGTPQRSHFGFIYPHKKALSEIRPKLKALASFFKSGVTVNEKNVYIAKSVPEVPQKVDCPLGACFMIKRECLEEVGLMDENIFIYADEVDFAFRAKKAGWNRYLIPEAKALHEKAASTGKKVSLMYTIHTQSNFYYSYKHFGIKGWLVIKLGFLIGGLLALLLSFVSYLFRKGDYKNDVLQYKEDFQVAMKLFFLRKKVLPPDAI